MKYDPKKHKRRSIRLKEYDYSSEGMYFVTVCVKGRECMLGEISVNQVRLSAIGQVVKECWEEIPEHFSVCTLGEFVVMPNHVHGIIFLSGSSRPSVTGRGFIPENGLMYKPVRVEYIQPQRGKESYQHVIPGSLGSIVRCFKSAVTRKCRVGISSSFAWQRNYYEHVIRDGEDLDRIREYILENPANWEGDENLPGNIRMDPLHRGNKDWSALD